MTVFQLLVVKIKTASTANALAVLADLARRGVADEFERDLLAALIDRRLAELKKGDTMIVRRIFERHTNGDAAEILVIFDTDTGDMHVATRGQSWHTWSPPLQQTRCDDDLPAKEES